MSFSLDVLRGTFGKYHENWYVRISVTNQRYLPKICGSKMVGGEGR